MAQDWNIFSVGREPGNEDQLTEMLAWLASRVPEAGRVVLGLALDGVELNDSESLEVSTQKRIGAARLDAVIRTPSATVVVESKLGSVYGIDQLRKYVEWLAESTSSDSHRALMTLTARDAPWPSGDAARATELGVAAVAKGWKDLYDAFGILLEEARNDGIEQTLVSEFRDMLKDEALVPVSPLGGEDFGDLWSKSDAVICRYHDFFSACSASIAQGLDATSLKGRINKGQTYVYEEFRTSAEFVTLGLNFSDRTVLAKPGQARNLPVIWMAFSSEGWSDWGSTIDAVEVSPPADWRVSHKRWYQQPRFWRYLSDVVQPGSLDEQRAEIEAACATLAAWLTPLRATHVKPKRTRRRRPRSS